MKQDKILQEYAGCSLLALPSAQENAPLVIAQAMAAGKPVVATRVGGVAEMVGEECERGLLIPVGDVGRTGQVDAEPAARVRGCVSAWDRPAASLPARTITRTG